MQITCRPGAASCAPSAAGNAQPSDPSARMNWRPACLDLGEGARPGGGIAGVRDEHGVVGHLRLERGHDGLGTHRLAVAAVVRGQLGPLLAPGGPLRPASLRRAGPRRPTAGPAAGRQASSTASRNVRASARRPSAVGKFRPIASGSTFTWMSSAPGVIEAIRVGDEAAEAGPDRQHDVRLAQRGVGVVARVAPDAAERQLVGLGDAALAGTARGDRDLQPFREPCAGRRRRRTGGCRCRPG